MPGLNDELSKRIRDKQQDNLLNELLRFEGIDDAEALLQTFELLDQISSHPVREIFDSSYVQLNGSHSTKFSDLVKLSLALRDSIQNVIFDVYQFRPICATKFDLYTQLLNIVAMRGDVSVTVNEHRIFTTNYDRIIEEFCAHSEAFQIRDGFDYDAKRKRTLWRPRSFEMPVPPGAETPIKLFKLHGSLNWKSSEYGIEQVLPESRFAEPTPVYKEDLLIYPGSKERPDREPFRTLYDLFESSMRETDRCLVIGFSFRDPYLNRVFRDFIESGKGQLLTMSRNCKETVAKNLLGAKDAADLTEYIEAGTLVPISSHFGEEGWIELLTAAVKQIPFPLGKISFSN
jgi:hypothetical protein